MTVPNRRRHPAAAIAQICLIVSLIWSAGALAWLSLAAVDFAYPLLYDALDIDAHIERYGPRNQYKQGFERTSRDERLALFAAIGEAVRRGGDGLDELAYLRPDGTVEPLLREPERIHLCSVARLLDLLARISWAMLGVLIASAAVLRRQRRGLPPARSVLSAAALSVAAATVVVFLLGPERVFNTLHVWVFPAGEQWFFYYEESLMTTLMKAPDLFGAIAALLVPLGLAYFGLGVALIRRLLAASPERG